MDMLDGQAPGPSAPQASPAAQLHVATASQDADDEELLALAMEDDPPPASLWGRLRVAQLQDSRPCSGRLPTSQQPSMMRRSRLPSVGRAARRRRCYSSLPGCRQQKSLRAVRMKMRMMQSRWFSQESSGQQRLWHPDLRS